MQCACSIMPSVACPALYIFQHYLKNGTIWGGGVGLIEHKMCVLIFSTTFACSTFHSKRK